MSSRVVLPVVYVSLAVAVIGLLELAKRSSAPALAIPPLEAPLSARPPLTPPPSPAPPATPLKPVECPGSLLHFFSSIPVPAAALDAAAMRTILRAGDWLGAPASLRTTPLDVALCPDLPTLLQVERDHGFVHVYGYADSQSVSRTFAPRGGYYHDLRLVALLTAPQVDLRLTISHELSHHVFESTTSARCDPIDEGLAEFTSAWLVFAPELAPADARISVVKHLDRLRQDLASGTPPNLAMLFDLNYWQFRDDRLKWHPFAQSWSLVQFLVTTRDPELRDRIPAILARVRAGGVGAAGLLGGDALPGIGKAWRAHVNRLLDECPLEDVSGDYYTLGNRLIGVLSGVGTAIAVVRHGHRWENATTLSTRLSSFPWHAWSAGFVVDYLSPESFTLIGIVPERRIVQCARLESGRFVFSEPVDLNREFDPASEPVCIERTADGHARVTQGARLLARFALAGGPKGRIGLYLERVRPKDDAFVEAQLEFTDVAAR